MAVTWKEGVTSEVPPLEPYGNAPSYLSNGLRVNLQAILQIPSWQASSLPEGKPQETTQDRTTLRTCGSLLADRWLRPSYRRFPKQPTSYCWASRSLNRPAKHW